MQARAWDTVDPPRRSCIRSRRFVEWFLRLRETMQGIGSATGAQLEIARLSVMGSLFIRDDTNLYGAIGRTADKLAKYAIGAQIWGVLTPGEQQILELRNAVAGHGTLQCERRIADLTDGDGATIVDLCRDEETGEMNGWAVVEVLNPIAPTNEAIAAHLGIRESKVRSRTESAHRKIDAHPLLQALGNQEA